MIAKYNGKSNSDYSQSLLPYFCEKTEYKLTKEEWVTLYHELDYKPYWFTFERS